MITKKIKLSTIDDVKNFVNATLSCPDDIYLLSGRYTVDAKSIMGIFSMDLSKEVEMQIESSTEPTEFLNAIKSYII
jgi:phosphotransferase system HPr-like phosphotransfer protein